MPTDEWDSMERALSGLRDFANSVRSNSQVTTGALASLQGRVARLESLLDPLPPGLDGARTDARIESVHGDIQRVREIVIDQSRTFEEDVAELTSTTNAFHEALAVRDERLDSLERRLEALIVSQANRGFDGN